MINLLIIDNFKSISWLEMPLSKFNCLVGMNGAGKSTLLQAIDFATRQLSGDIEDWLNARGWEAKDLSCKLRKEQNIKMALSVSLPKSQKTISWAFSFNKKELRCTHEEFKDVTGALVFFSDGQHYFTSGTSGSKREIGFTYQGSILSRLKDSELSDELREFRDHIRRVKSLELLSPQLLRKRARSGETDIGAGGEKLSAYLHGIKGEQRLSLIALLQVFYPSLVDFKITNMRAGWKRLSIIEQFGTHKIETDASHINDGLLRILAVLAQTQSEHSLVLLDEIENGINTEIVEKLVDTLSGAKQQIIVTSHSPMILNYMTDEIARKAVQFVYKSSLGLTGVRRFFDVPRIGQKLACMGPGEAFVDTDLSQLADECVNMDSLAAETREKDFKEALSRYLENMAAERRDIP